MKKLFVIGSLVLTVLVAPAVAQSTAPAPTNGDATAPAPAEHKHLVFKPTSDDSDGVAPIQVGGGSRGTEGPNITLETLVPNATALTTQEQPSLYWYQSASSNVALEVTLIEPKHPKPLLELKTGATTPAGIHAIRLSKFNIKLDPNVVYKWSVAVVADSSSRSADTVASGVIKRITPSPDLAAKLAAASDDDKAAIYAQNSIWYDALQSISDQIDRDPKNQALRDERADLISQVGLKGKDMEETVVKSP